MKSPSKFNLKGNQVKFHPIDLARKMNNKVTKQLSLLVPLFLCCCISSFAQSNTPPANPIPAPFQQATNQTASLAVFQAALNLLPAWDPTQTNDFASGEFTIESAPLWKTESASGTTPYNSTEADYFFNRNIGFGAEVVSLGNGAGSSSIDTFGANLTLRKDIGNIAGYLLLGGGYDVNKSKAEGAFGPGLIYQYQTHLRLFLDTRFEFEGTKNSDSGFLTRVGLQIPF
jgi:hypothetical protein